jgi:retron-type reverse transcriptase
LEDWKYNATYSGVPQGGVVSPILSNLVLDRLDQFVERELIPVYTDGKRRRTNPPYVALTFAASDARKQGNLEERQGNLKENLEERQGNLEEKEEPTRENNLFRCEGLQ